MRPKISIITATYNSAKTLEQSLLSVISQGYNNIEYIVIDGGSKDGTLGILEKYNSEISYWISEKDKGIYDAWNKGVEKATGDWIAFLGSDDFFYPDAIQHYVDFINKEQINNTDCLYISSKIEMITEEGRVLRTYGWPWNWEQFRRVNIIAHPGSLQSKYLFEKYGNYDINYKIVGDYELLLRPQKSLNAKFINTVTVKMTVGGASNQLKMFKELKKVIIVRGGVSVLRANFDYYIHITKLYFKNLGLRFGINLYWKRAHK
ncbi:glycosyltransferase family 2 protein [Arcicella rigui]|uniref:Glycosyltransferase family 2 protein n=1 Tax=Arcicella rigui TaxID=797020 RepID=A0ABU5QA61_9BACT|nr:glycosyltransferase family 2 protein [Arcicella rigui]MEA5139284.1 glycosyltransferase family 2 protein [Arcicella rigui]